MLRSTLIEKTEVINYPTQSGDTVQVLTGENALQQLSEESFIEDWKALYDACPWATVFQSQPFVSTWYDAYKKEYTPVVVIGISDGQLTGLLQLAQNKKGIITGAGEELAEYHVWLSNGNGSTFIEAALKKLYTTLKGCTIQLKYLPAAAPLEWIQKDPFFKNHCFAKAFRHPLLKLDLPHLEKELKKKNRKEKINRLKRLGSLDFEHITEYETFDSIIDALVIQFDFRKGALYNTFFFQDDPCRKPFLLALFKKGLLHVSVLKSNGEIIASNASLFGKSWVHLQGLNTHAPAFSKHSPGILHFLMLGQHLAKNGFSIFDLTPGDDPYKDILATDYVTSHQLTLDKSLHRFVGASHSSITDYLKKGLLMLGFLPKPLKSKKAYYFNKLKQINKQDLITLPTSLIKFFSKNKNVYVLQEEPATISQAVPDIRKNDLKDLMLFQSEGFFNTRWGFLKEAMYRFDNGQSCYTWCENEQLRCCVWLLHQPKKEDLKGIDADEAMLSSAVLDGLYYAAEAKTLLASFIHSVSTIARQSTPTRTVYAIAPANDRFLNRVLKSLHFESYKQR